MQEAPSAPAGCRGRTRWPRFAVAEGEGGGGFGGVEQLSRYLDLMRRDTLLGTVHGILAAQLIKPQARVLASDRSISCVTVDYDLLGGLKRAEDRLF
jgi:RecB family endonuclease NucS